MYARNALVDYTYRQEMDVSTGRTQYEYGNLTKLWSHDTKEMVPSSTILLEPYSCDFAYTVKILVACEFLTLLQKSLLVGICLISGQ